MSRNPHYVAYDSGHRDATEAARVVAFGAIRRAAEIARDHERHARYCESKSGEWFAAGDEDMWRSWQQSMTFAINSMYQIRRAIRAAIGSDKT